MDEELMTPGRDKWIKAGLAALLLAALVATAQVWDLAQYFSPDKIRHWLEAAGPWAPLAYVAVMALAVVVSPIPSVPLDVAAGAFFGPWLGTLYSAIGALAGAAASFLIARFLGRELLERFLSSHIDFCTKCSDKLLAKVVFISRLVPVVSFDLVSYGAGLTKMSLGRFCLATFLGMLPLTFVYNYFGSVLVVSRWVALILGAAVVALFFLLPMLVERFNFLGLKKFFGHLSPPPNGTQDDLSGGR